MKKLIKVILISIGVIIVLMIIMPLTMKSKIQQMVRLEAQELLNAEFNFDDISISLFRSFPDLSVSVQNVSVTGRTPFEGDTLLAAQHIYAAVNVLSLLGNDGFQISEVSLKKPLIQGIVDSKGRANWEIMKRSDSTAQSDILIEADETVVRLNLKRLHIENAEIRYRDSLAGTNLCLAGMNTVLSGNMDADQTLLKSKLSIADIRLMKANTTYLKQVSLEAEVDIDADLKHKKFTFHENNVSVNAIRTSLDGWVALQDTTGMDMDLQLNTSEVGFKEILSLIPAIYQHDFKDLQAEGRVGLSARAKGELRRGVLPAFETRLNIENGSFRYPSFAEGISDIQVDMAITSPGGSPDLIRADISRFHFLLSGNPFDLTARVTHFISDPEFALTAFGKMNLGKIREIYPLSDSVRLSGIVTTDLSVAGKMSQIEKEQYEQILAKGSVQVQKMTIAQKQGAPLAVETAMMIFTPQFVELEKCEASVGKNNIALSGKLQNFIPYILKDQTLKGSLRVSSDYICLNDFMTVQDSVAVPVQTEAAADTVSPALLLIPRNLDFTATVDLKEVVLDHMALSAITGDIRINKGMLTLNGLQLSAFGGKIIATGKYDTSDATSPVLDMQLAVEDASFAKTFGSIESVRKMAPVFENMTGRYSMNLDFETHLLPGMTPDLNSVNAKGTLNSRDVKISGVAALDKLAEVLKRDALKTITPKDLNLTFVVKQGRITIDPFQLKLGDTVLSLGGTTGLDQTIDYKGSVILPADGFKALGIHVKSLPFTITGTYKHPDVALDMKALSSSASDAIGNLFKEIKKKVK